MNKINFTSFNPIIDIQDNILFANNGNVVLCYEVKLPEIYSLSEKDFSDMHGAWFQALKSLPIGTVVHKQDVYLKKEYTSDELPDHTFLEKATHDHFKGREYMEHRCYLFFILTKNKALNNPKYVNPFKKVSKNMIREMDDVVKSFIGAVRDSISFINNSRKIQINSMLSQEIEQLTQAYFNGFNEGFDTDSLLEQQHIQMGDNYFDALAVNSELCFGESVQSSKTNERFTSDDFVFHQGFIDGIGLNLKENHLVNQILYLDDKHKWRKLLDKKVEELQKSSNFGSQNKVVLEKISHILTQINADDNAKIIRGHLNVIFLGSTKTKLKKNCFQDQNRI